MFDQIFIKNILKIKKWLLGENELYPFKSIRYVLNLANKYKIYDYKKINEDLIKIRNIINYDIEFYLISDPACVDRNELINAYPGLFAICLYRFSHYLYLNNILYVPRMISEYVHSSTGIDIHPGASIGPYFFIDHGTGVVIGETSIIGHHVKIYQNVTLGALSLSKGYLLKNKKRHPTIGNYVTIYEGASILGGDTLIGDNVTIGADVLIDESIENNVIIVVKKEFIKKMKGDKNDHI